MRMTRRGLAGEERPVPLGPYVVLEGPDGVGKTTLAEQITQRWGWPIVHSGPPDRLAWVEWIGKTFVEGPAVFDRLHIGSIAYGGAFRNMFDVTDHENWLVEGWLMSRGCMVIHCDVPKSVQDANLSRGPDNEDAAIYEDSAKRDLVRDLYNRYFANELHVKSNIPPVRYDYTQDSMGLMAARAFEFLDQRSRLWGMEAVALGNTMDPKLVLIGDEPHDMTKARQRARAQGLNWDRYKQMVVARANPEHWATFGGQSGRYLHMCFRMAGLELRDTMIVNSRSWVLEDQLQDSTVQNACRGARVVALGNKAEERARAAGIRVDTRIPHPQYWKRFRYKEQHVYAKLLNGRMSIADVPEPAFATAS